MSFHSKTVQVLKSQYLAIQLKVTPPFLLSLRKIRRLLHLYLSRLQAELRILLPVLFLFLLILNLTAGKTAFETNKLNILNNPRDTASRLILVTKLLESNQLDEAEKELQQADSKQSLVTEKLAATQKIRSQPEEIKNQILFWEKVTRELPNFRDAHLKLAILDWKINYLFAAKVNLEKALKIDPNNEVANQLLALF